MLGLPSYCLVHHFPSEARICIAYHILHIIHVLHHVACAFLVIDYGSVACVLVLGRSGRRVHERGTCWVRLRGSTFDNSENLAGKMTIPWISLISLLASTRSIAMLALPDTVYHASLLPCQTSNHPFLANRCLAMSPLLLSPSYSVASCRRRWSLFHVGTWICWDITISLILINASIYLVKGGRLGLMPGDLFHSCRLSFRHTGVMFLDFAFLTRLGDLWDPLDSSPWIRLLQQGPTLVLLFAA